MKGIEKKMASQNVKANESLNSNCQDNINVSTSNAVDAKTSTAGAFASSNDDNFECHFSEHTSGATRLNAVRAAKQWPVKLKLVPDKAEFLDDSKLLLAADCASCTYASFYKDYIHGRTVLISCPKFDSQDCCQKLSQILQNNNIRSLMVVRMDVPCCAPLEQMAIEALNNSGKFIPWQVVKISTNGEISEQR